MTTDFEAKAHWEKIYETKSLDEVSWYQPVPSTSLDYIQHLKLPLNAAIIDVGGGDSFLVDHLLNAGYTNVTVLDISSKAIDRAQKRLGDRSEQVTWIVSDINDFNANGQYDLWHDRAAFHFLTDTEQITAYVHRVSKALTSFGALVLASFSENGPTKCSGIAITQYSQQSMVQLFQNDFVKMDCTNVDHPTPFGTVQNFTFCSFKRKASS